ncbi:hypothetical protein BGAL_0071g00270 [Botrytis galanthina]|uniref:Uncharacterized protein n=1 Tax=Botrytis galanthina TaxID=278940 RepID=A0A4S8RE18_9HELO|nr:hypothetical protein BGAL_0071g00270 [Botrytis galanthina]
MLKDEKPLIETIPAGHVLFTYSWSDALFAKSTRSKVGKMGGVVTIQAIQAPSSGASTGVLDRTPFRTASTSYLLSHHDSRHPKLQKCINNHEEINDIVIKPKHHASPPHKAIGQK